MARRVLAFSGRVVALPPIGVKKQNIKLKKSVVFSSEKIINGNVERVGYPY